MSAAAAAEVPRRPAGTERPDAPGTAGSVAPFVVVVVVDVVVAAVAVAAAAVVT